MNRQELLAFHADLSRKARAVMEKKNQDYGRSSDIFANFRAFGTYGILVRMSDKIARLVSYEEKGHFAVEDEGLQDTIADIINYAVLYAAYPREYNTPGNSFNGPGDKHGPEKVSEGATVLEGQAKQSVGREMAGGCPCSCHRTSSELWCTPCIYKHPPLAKVRGLGDSTGTPY